MRNFASALIAVLFVAATSAHADTIELKNGDTITGQVVDTNDQEIVIEHPTLGRVVVPKSDIKPEEVEPVIPGLFGTSILEGWTKGLGLGASGTEGNIDDVNIRANGRLLKEDDRFRHKLLGAYLYKETEDIETQNEGYVDGEENFKFADSNFFLMATGRYDNDKFQAWRHRIAGSVGPGYQFFATERFNLRASIGAGVVHTWDGDKSTDPEGLARLEADYDFKNGFSFTTEHTWYPRLEDMPDSRIISSADVVADVGNERGFVMSFGIDNEYDDSRIGDNNEFKYHALVGYEF